MTAQRERQGEGGEGEEEEEEGEGQDRGPQGPQGPQGRPVPRPDPDRTCRRVPRRQLSEPDPERERRPLPERAGAHQRLGAGGAHLRAGGLQRRRLKRRGRPDRVPRRSSAASATTPRSVARRSQSTTGGGCNSALRRRARCRANTTGIANSAFGRHALALRENGLATTTRPLAKTRSQATTPGSTTRRSAATRCSPTPPVSHNSAVGHSALALNTNGLRQYGGGRRGPV